MKPTEPSDDDSIQGNHVGSRFSTVLGFEKSAEFVRKRLAEAGETFSDSDIFEPFHSALLDLFRRSAWRELGCPQENFWLHKFSL